MNEDRTEKTMTQATQTRHHQRQPQQQRGGQLAQRTDTHWLQGSFRKARDVNERLASACSNAHLIAPATAVGHLPEGCAIALNVVTVDTRDMREGGEVYNPGGGLALARSVLNRIAAAAGVSWDAQLSGRLDNGSDPNYCHFRAVGWYRSFDGTELQITGEKEMDLRDGSPQLQSMLARSKSGDITKQLRELRLHILAHAESKAKNRAIRSLGLKSSFSREELQKPFVAAKLVWTGQSDDPALRRLFAEGTMQRMLGGSRALFGPAPAPTAPPQRQLKAPPPVGTVGHEPDDYIPAPYDAPLPPASAEGVIDAPVSSTPAAQQQAPPARPTPRSPSGLTIPGGREKNVPLHEASDNSLEWWAEKIATSLENGQTEARFVDKDRALLDAMNAELAARRGTGMPPGAVPPEDEPDWDDEGRY